MMERPTEKIQEVKEGFGKKEEFESTIEKLLAENWPCAANSVAAKLKCLCGCKVEMSVYVIAGVQWECVK